MPRNRSEEHAAVLAREALRIGQLVDDRNTGKLGEEAIKLAQVLILCTLPYSATHERQISRKARLGDGSTLGVTFIAGRQGIPLPYGADRRLLTWLLDRAITSGSPFVDWASCWQYQTDMGLSHSGKSNQNLQASFRRVRGLAIGIRRKDAQAVAEENFFVVRRSFLPKSISGEEEETHEACEAMNAEQEQRHGVLIDPVLFEDLRRFHVAVPWSLWKQVKGNSQVRDIVLWLYARCYAARSESVIPWATLSDQFGIDSNPRRQKSYAREAIRTLRLIWPQANIEAINAGILVDRAAAPLLVDDPSRHRFRRLK